MEFYTMIFVCLQLPWLLHHERHEATSPERLQSSVLTTVSVLCLFTSHDHCLFTSDIHGYICMSRGSSHSYKSKLKQICEIMSSGWGFVGNSSRQTDCSISLNARADYILGHRLKLEGYVSSNQSADIARAYMRSCLWFANILATWPTSDFILQHNRLLTPLHGGNYSLE